MITLTEFKQYLNIVETEYDVQLQGFITSAITQLNSLCNRDFIKNDYTEVIECNLFSNAIYLKSSPINSVTSIKYYDSNSLPLKTNHTNQNYTALFYCSAFLSPVKIPSILRR